MAAGQFWPRAPLFVVIVRFFAFFLLSIFVVTLKMTMHANVVHFRLLKMVKGNLKVSKCVNHKSDKDPCVNTGVNASSRGQPLLTFGELSKT